MSEACRLFRVIPPRENDTGIKAVAHMLESMIGTDPISLEILLEPGGRRSFFARLPKTIGASGCLVYLRGAHPQVAWQEVPVDPLLAAELDPAQPACGQEFAQAELRQRNDPGCPLRLELDDDDFREADPIVPLLHAGDNLQEGEKLLFQVVARRSNKDRFGRYRALAAGDAGRPMRQSLSSLGPARLFLGLGFALLFGLSGTFFFRTGNHGYGALAFVAAIAATIGSWLLFRASQWALEVDPELIAAKLRYQAYDAQVRATAYGPLAQQRLEMALAAYAQIGRGATNCLVPRPASFDPRTPDLQARPKLGPLKEGFCWLNSAELALLWHFPQGMAEMGGLERTPFTALLPSGDQMLTSRSGFHAGETDHPEARRSIYLPRELLEEHIAVLGASGMGKSNLLRLIGRWILESGGQLVAIDPHEELAEYLAGAVPEGQREKTVYVKASNRPYPFGLNLLSVEPERAADYADFVIFGCQEGIDKAIGTVLSTMERAQAEAWGQRMRSIAASGAKLMAEVGRATGFDYTILDLETLLDDLNLVRDLVTIYRRVGEDPMVVGYWYDGWMRATESQRREWAYSTVNRINLLKSGVMGNIVGSRKTTLDVDRILAEGRHLIVDAATGWDENTRVLMGLILDQVNLAVRRLPKSSQPRIYVMLDEFQLINSANLQGLVNELRKWGVRFVLGTQGLGSLQDPATARVVLNNVQQVFAFSTGPEEQRTAAALLGGAVEPEALGSLSSYHCYARLRLNGRVQPVFSFEVARAPEENEAAREAILARSQREWCRPLEVVARERRIIGEKYTLVRYDRNASWGFPARWEGPSAGETFAQAPVQVALSPPRLEQSKPSRRERAKVKIRETKGKPGVSKKPIDAEYPRQQPLFEEEFNGDSIAGDERSED